MGRPKGSLNKKQKTSNVPGYCSVLRILISPELHADFRIYCTINNVSQKEVIEDYLKKLTKEGE